MGDRFQGKSRLWEKKALYQSPMSAVGNGKENSKTNTLCLLSWCWDWFMNQKITVIVRLGNMNYTNYIPVTVTRI
jgi:hypothetical protein